MIFKYFLGAGFTRELLFEAKSNGAREFETSYTIVKVLGSRLYNKVNL